MLLKADSMTPGLPQHKREEGTDFWISLLSRPFRNLDATLSKPKQSWQSEWHHIQNNPLNDLEENSSCDDLDLDGKPQTCGTGRLLHVKEPDSKSTKLLEIRVEKTQSHAVLLPEGCSLEKR